MACGDAFALIPARAGSKGLPGKNLLTVGGMTLVARAVTVAQEVSGIEQVVVSTDGDDIAEEAKRCGASVHRRTAHLASDDALVSDTIRHVIQGLQAVERLPKYGVLLEPTSPLRTVEDVERCLGAVRDGADSAATFTEAALHPNRAFVIEPDGSVAPFLAGAVPWQPRQALEPPAYQLTGSAYAFDCERFPAEGASVLFGAIAAVVVPRDRSYDIDDAVDLYVVEALLARK